MLKKENAIVNGLPSQDDQWLVPVDLQQYAANISCCGGDEKKNLVKNPVKTARLVKEVTPQAKAAAAAEDPDDQRIIKVAQQQQQQAPRAEIDDDLKDLFGKKDLTKAMINQLVQRSMAGSMNANNDDPPLICTRKHVSFREQPGDTSPVWFSQVFIRQ